jgi:serine/threonine-protein kinase RsbW
MGRPLTNPLTFAGTLDSLGEIGRYLDEESSAAGLSRQQAYNLRLAVDEVATNIVVHGYQENAQSGEIVVRMETSDEAVTVTLEDTSPPFDPTRRAMPTDEDLTKPLEDRKIGGLGIFLAMKSVDQFRYERRGNRNLNTFVVHRQRN